MEYIFTIVLLFLFYWGIRKLGDKIRQKQTEKIFVEYEEKEHQRDIEREREYNLVIPMIDEFYAAILATWQMPSNTLIAGVIRAKSANDLGSLKEILPNEWTTWADDCNCWTAEDTLYIVLPQSEALAKAKNTPAAYNTEEKICSAFPHWAIPFDCIRYYKAVGDVIQTERIVGGGNVSYTGVSVNGIGFGELKHDPVISAPEIQDDRYIVLYYQEDAEKPLQTIYFCYDALNTLIRLIPQFER